jgi:hypothetical protein
METHSAKIGGLAYFGDLADPSEFLEHLRAWGIRHTDMVGGASGFETQIVVPGNPAYVAVRALGATGRTLAESKPVQVGA